MWGWLGRLARALAAPRGEARCPRCGEPLRALDVLDTPDGPIAVCQCGEFAPCVVVGGRVYRNLMEVP